MHPDQKYIDALRNNDHVLIEEIYSKYAAGIVRLVTQNQGTVKDAKDIFQEGLMDIFRKAQQKAFVLSCPFEAFLYIICKRKWINELNKRKRRGVTIRDTAVYTNIEAEAVVWEEWVEQQEQKNLFWKHFQTLGESCRNILSLSWSGIDMNEVAQRLGISYRYALKKKSECKSRLIMLVKSDPIFKHLTISTDGG